MPKGGGGSLYYLPCYEKEVTHKTSSGQEQGNNNKNKFILFQEDIQQGTIRALLNYLTYC